MKYDFLYIKKVYPTILFPVDTRAHCTRETIGGSSPPSLSVILSWTAVGGGMAGSLDILFLKKFFFIPL